MESIPRRRRHGRWIHLALAALLWGSQTGLPEQPQEISLRDCLLAALLQNRDLQIERLNPPVARMALDASYGYYDPVFFGTVRREKSSDSGGFDPADFSRDAIYDAESRVASAGLSGFLPGGLNYVFGGNYANSFGTRNGFDFDSYRLFGDVTVRQPLLKNFWIDQGRMVIKVNKRNLRISELGVAYMTMDVVNQVRQAYADFLFAREQLDIQARLISVRQRLAQGVARQLQEGTAALPDRQLTEARLASVENDWLIASNQVVLAENALRTLMGDPFDSEPVHRWKPTDRLLVLPENFELRERWYHGLAQRPDLEQMRQDVDRAKIDVSFRRNQLFPALDVVAGYSRKGASVSQPIFPPSSADASLSDAWDQWREGTTPSEMVGLVLSIPLGRVSERASYRSSRTLLEQAQLRVEQKKELVLREISDAVFSARAAFQRIAAARRALDLAEAAVKAEETRLAGGKSTLFFLLDLQDNMTAQQVAEARAKADYNKAVSQVHFAEGDLLDQSRIALDIR